MITTAPIATDDILEAIRTGLASEPKHLPGWLIYDECGLELFEKVKSFLEYYPVWGEQQIIDHHIEDLKRYFEAAPEGFQLIELGAGDSIRTDDVLRYLHHGNLKFTYCPAHFSERALEGIKKRISAKIPSMVIQPIAKNDFDALHQLEGGSGKVVLMLGARIGQLSFEDAEEFLKSMESTFGARDFALIGFDLKKDPALILELYNDEDHVMKECNLNILNRLNHEFGATFDVNRFDYTASYDPEKSLVRSFLVSLTDQSVYVAALKQSFRFTQWETIRTEVSQKYDLLTMERLLSGAGFEIVDLFFDAEQYFCNVLVKSARW